MNIQYRNAHAHPVHPWPKGFCHAMVSRPARGGRSRLKQRLSSGLRRLLHTGSRVRIVLETRRTSPSLSFVVARGRPNLRVPSVSVISPFFFHSFSTGFSRGLNDPASPACFYRRNGVAGKQTLRDERRYFSADCAWRDENGCAWFRGRGGKGACW